MSRSPRDPKSPSKLFARIAVGGLTLAVLALGALAVWAALVTQNGANGLSQAGVQTSGHLRAVQALSLIDTSTDALEEEANAADLEKLRTAQRVLDDALGRMENGGVLDAGRIAEQAKPLVLRLDLVIERFLVDAGSAEEELETTLGELQVLLNDLDSDPSQLLATKLAAVTATERTVRATAFALIPLGLGGVAACGWLLSLYRRRAEATMRSTLELTAHEARTDELTGLPNRRALLEEFDRLNESGAGFTLTLADLNGFKRYNDTFGHPAGDALLRRLGGKLAAACEGRGIAARLGGDEFCILLDGHILPSAAHRLLREALCDEGEGFSISCSSGLATIPAEAKDSSDALRLADSRMYAAKVHAHGSAEDGVAGALMRMLDERHPGLASHVEEVGILALATAEALELSADETQLIARAAELHDIGKVGIPSAILTKRGPLTDEETIFMRRHSIIGERILTGVPSLERVAALVRSSHERWDGDGYPDRLKRDDIPLGARIIFVADAFCAMTERRPYAAARSVASASRELRRCAGSQFDPAVVAAFTAVLDNRTSQAEARPAAAAAAAFR